MKHYELMHTPLLVNRLSYFILGVVMIIGITPYYSLAEKEFCYPIVNLHSISLAETEMVVDAGDDKFICAGESVQLNATGANSFQWKPVTGLSCTNCPNPVASPSETTVYIVEGNDGTSDTVSVIVSTPPSFISFSTNNLSECQLANGSIAVNATGTGDGLEYSITGKPWQESPVFLSLPAGEYEIFIRNQNGSCVVTGGTVSLTAPVPPQILNILPSNPTSCDAKDGTILIQAASGNGSYQFSVDNGLSWQSQNNFQQLGSGIYQIKVRNSDGSCEITGGQVSLTGSLAEADIIEVYVAQPTNCGLQDGLITIVISNDDGNFEFSSNGGLQFQASNTFSNLGAGDYHLMVRKTNGTCQKDAGKVILNSSNAPVILGISNTDPQTCGAHDGAIAISAEGPSTVEYSIDGGAHWQLSNEFENLPAGNYTVAVQNEGGGCFASNGNTVLPDGPPPVISNVTKTNPSSCEVNGSISITAQGNSLLEYSIDNGANWSSTSQFTGLATGSYRVAIRFTGGSCTVPYGSNPIVLSDTGSDLTISQVLVENPGSCGVDDGSIRIEATGSGNLLYSINGGATTQPSNFFDGLPAGSYNIVVKQAGGNCIATDNTTLVVQGACTDTLTVVIPAGEITEYCLPPGVFEIPGSPTGAGFCNQGNLATVIAPEVNGTCVTLVPANGYTGTSPHIICVVHCFNNSLAQCDTTFLRVTVSSFSCDAIFSQDTISAQFINNPTPVCLPIPPAIAGTYDLFLNGVPLSNLQGCDFDSVVIYSYSFLPGGGFNGPYTLNSWVVNGNTYNGFITNMTDLVSLMNAFDPTGNWQINMVTGIIFGGDLTKNYGNIQLAHVPSGSTSLMTANFTILPNGFIVNLTSSDLHTLLAVNPADGCADTLFINLSVPPPQTQIIELTTTINHPTEKICLSPIELPGHSIEHVGYCRLPAHGTAPLVSDTCIMYIPNQGFTGRDTFCVMVCDGSIPSVCDTAIFIVNVLPGPSNPTTDTIFQTTLVNVGVQPGCANTDELPGNLATSNFCKLPVHGAVSIVNDTCVAYQPNTNFVGTDDFCIVLCDDSQPAVCDTFVYVIKTGLPVDTLEVNTPGVGPFNVCLGGTELQLPGAVASASVCFSNPAEINLTMQENCITIDPSNHFFGTSVACLVHCDNNSPSICDTTILIVNVPDVCGQSELFPADTVTMTINNCAALKPYCVPLKVDSLGSYGILDNGHPYTGGFETCNGDQLQILLDTGFHEIVFFHLAKGCSDTLLAKVLCGVNPIGCGVQAISPPTLAVTHCDDEASFCLNLSPSDLQRFVVKHEDEIISGFSPCGIDSSKISFLLPVGSHWVTVADTTKGCADTFLVDVTCPLYDDIVLDTAVLKAGSKVVCIADFGFPISQIDNVVNECSGQTTGNANFSINQSTWCITVNGISNGLDSACFRVMVGGTTALVTVRVTVEGACPDWLPDTLHTAAGCQSNSGMVCLPVSITELQGKVLLVDGAAYSGTVTPCDFDSIFILNYSEIPGMGKAGPYTLLNWNINGVNFSGVFNSAQQVADSMSVWDQLADWSVVIDPVTQGVFIVGGSPRNNYGVFDVSQNSTGIRAQLGINAVFRPNGIGVVLGAGIHKVSISDPATGCVDSTLVNFYCVFSEEFSDTVAVGESNIYCPDKSELPGNLASVLNTCPGTGDVVDFAIQGDCMNYLGNRIGHDSVCLVLCDDLGVCDTTFIFITVVAGPPGPNAVNDTLSTLPGKVVVSKVLNNDAFGQLTRSGIVAPPSHGQAVLMADGSAIYTPNEGYCDDSVPDSFTYEICDAVGCDTATVFVSVKCSELEIFNGFSPNGDKINDVFKINGLQNFPSHHLRIYNRWGNLVFEAVNYQNTWDGKFNGKDLPDGTYFYLLDLGNGEKPLSGFVHLNR